MAKQKANDEDVDLLEELGVEVEAEAPTGRTALEQRIIAGFEEIERFYREHGRRPEHGEGRDIFERLYAVRLDRIRASDECLAIVKPFDQHGLLSEDRGTAVAAEAATDEELLAQLGVDVPQAEDVTQLTHVRAHVDRKAAEEVAQRKPCADFEQFRPVFQRVQKDIEIGLRKTAPFQHNGRLDPGDMFILDGQKVLVAEGGEWMTKEFGREDRRLRVIFDNGTESNLLHRSLQRALYKDENNRRILGPDSQTAPLFGSQPEEGDLQSGTVYVVRSNSTHPFIHEHRELLHKIGVTGGDVTTRLANAAKDPTFLLAGVEVVATYQLANIKRHAFEAALHKILAPARIDLAIEDRFGESVQPREWFLVPLKVIDEVIARIIDGTIVRFTYRPDAAKLIEG